MLRSTVVHRLHGAVSPILDPQTHILVLTFLKGAQCFSGLRPLSLEVDN
jgi:hypothetical protein